MSPAAAAIVREARIEARIAALERRIKALQGGDLTDVLRRAWARRS